MKKPQTSYGGKVECVQVHPVHDGVTDSVGFTLNNAQNAQASVYAVGRCHASRFWFGMHYDGLL